MQMDCIEEQEQNYIYIGLLRADSALQPVLIAEKCILGDIKTGVIASLIAAYFTFNIEYPKDSKPVMQFFEYILGINRNKKFLISVNRIIAALNAL